MGLMTSAQFRALVGDDRASQLLGSDQAAGVSHGRQGNKYHAKPTEYDGVRYDSKAEACRARQLDQLRVAGEVRWWLRQVKVPLDALAYRVDFLVCDRRGETWCEDVKGVQTQRFRDLVKLWRRHGPMDLHVIERRGTTIIARTVADLTTGGPRDASRT